MQTAALAHPLAGRSVLKMNGIGNAIAILDLRGTDIVPTPGDARAIAAAPGLAYDQLMVVRDPPTAAVDAFMLIYNADGSRAGACGNGTRCVAWVLARDSDRETLVLATDAGPLPCQRLADGRFLIDMGAPRFRWDEIPLADASHDPRALVLDPGDPRLPPAFALSMGNPHAVLFVDDLDALDLAAIGPRLETAPAFPDRANISLAQVLSPRAIRLKVWERGAGATLACGSAACATLVAAAASGRTERAATVALPGGSLEIAWGADNHVAMTGPVTYEFTRVLDPALFEARAA